MNIYSIIINQEAISLYRASAPATEIGISLSTSRSTIYKWIIGQNKVPCGTLFCETLGIQRDKRSCA